MDERYVQDEWTENIIDNETGEIIGLHEVVDLLNKKDKELKRKSKKHYHNGLGKINPYYCRGNYIWRDNDGKITSKCREEFKKKDGKKYNHKENLLFYGNVYKTNMMLFDDIIKILNELDIENRRLKEKYDYDIEDYRQSNAELKKENGEQQSIIKAKDEEILKLKKDIIILQKRIELYKKL